MMFLSVCTLLLVSYNLSGSNAQHIPPSPPWHLAVPGPSFRPVVVEEWMTIHQTVTVTVIQSILSTNTPRPAIASSTNTPRPAIASSTNTPRPAIASLPDLAVPKLDPAAGTYANVFLVGVFLLFVMVVVYLGAYASWHIFSRCRRRWMLGSKYEMELREARVRVGESAGLSDVGSAGRVITQPAVGRRAGLWWRADHAGRATEREGGRRALRFSGVESKGTQRLRGSVVLEEV
ncbi:hypothetical protein BZA05DRAFT_406461 [Tricharina praecox]|uniref:uncharacterized protein n=1 Tax=Tricharina praecox TaxID=43433 RepID=UPI0022211904|nr:uncharacterized protein BZA05DRAFT_406461 [Tricharina praecox]KAI5846734.1 hypothetical protein BZA05DRAFT_406461 [Tricharina praecox]